MASKTEDDFKSEILDDLEKAGKAGLNKSQLGIKAKTKKEKALMALAKAGEISNLGTTSRHRWVLAVHDKPLEEAYDHILRTARSSNVELLPKSKLEEDLKGKIKSHFGEALRLLLQEQLLVKLKASRTFYYVHVDRIPVVVSADGKAGTVGEKDEPADRDASDVDEKVLRAYKKLVDESRFGFFDVHIARLRKEAGVTMEDLARFLRSQSRKGKAVLSIGDWSLSSDEDRSGAIYIDGTPYLLVRFE